MVLCPTLSKLLVYARPTEVALLNRLVLENLRQRPVRTCLSVLAIGVEVTMILTLVGISYGTLDETARRARGVGADILVRPPASSIISLSSSPMSEKLVPFLMKQPHVTFATGTMGQPLGGFDVLTGIDLAQFNRLSGGFRFIRGGPFGSDDDVIVDEYYAREKKLTLEAQSLWQTASGEYREFSSPESCPTSARG